MEQDNSLWKLPGDPRCVLCKGSKLLCGKERCPILVKFYAKQKTVPMLDSLKLEGSSPPSVFVGRFGYPKVYIGPMVPPVIGNTSIMDSPEQWAGLSIDEIVNFRFQLVRGKYLTDVHNFEGRIIEQTQEIAMAKSCPDTEITFKNKPTGRMVLDDEIAPFGPSARIEQMDINSVKAEYQIEKAYHDGDLKSRDAVFKLYEKGLPVSQIQKSFSVGLFGIDKNRKFVPTRWSITAVDSTLGNILLDETKDYPVINEYRIYETTALDNRWIILMLPREWCYELIEAWYPKTIWNPDGKDIMMVSSYEFYNGRKTYAEIGGCFYAARLAVNELLTKEKRQAGVVILREAHAGYIMPVGVWNVRENVRNALKNEPKKFSTLKECLDYIPQKMDIPLQTWMKNSTVLRDTMNQRRLTDFYESK
jgi:hypothetical protein